MSTPARLVGAVAGRGVGSLVPERLTLLVARDLEILVYPSDIAISGTKGVVARARAALATRLTASAAHLTTTKEAQEVEDRFRRSPRPSRTSNASGRPVVIPDLRRELGAIDRTLASLDIDYDEWEVLYRMRLQVERDLLVGARVGEAGPGQAPAGASAAPATSVGPAPAPNRESAPSIVLAIAGIAVVVLDVVVAVLDRLRPPQRGATR